MKLLCFTVLLLTVAANAANAGVRFEGSPAQKNMQHNMQSGYQHQAQSAKAPQCEITSADGKKCIITGTCGGITMANCEPNCGGGCKTTFFNANKQQISECAGGLPSAEMVKEDARSGRNIFMPNCIPKEWTCGNAEAQPAYGHCMRELRKTHNPSYSY